MRPGCLARFLHLGKFVGGGKIPRRSGLRHALFQSKRKLAARTALQVECRPELRSGEMEKTPVYKTGLQDKHRGRKCRFAACFKW
jgi:hypothetical protein